MFQNNSCGMYSRPGHLRLTTKWGFNGGCDYIHIADRVLWVAKSKIAVYNHHECPGCIQYKRGSLGLLKQRFNCGHRINLRLKKAVELGRSCGNVHDKPSGRNYMPSLATHRGSNYSQTVIRNKKVKCFNYLSFVPK